jgi:endonuclease III
MVRWDCMDSKNINKILEVLGDTYPDAKCALDFNTPYELLVATILSAQCTDIRVNIITMELFKNFNTPQTMITLSTEELEEKVKSSGFYRNKSKNIINTSQYLLDNYDGMVPETMDELLKLPGVGRKTANVLISNAFGGQAIAVDTHVFRLANRIGLGIGSDPYKVEIAMMKNIPQDMWSISHNYLIWHGRLVCKARKPDCENCTIRSLCDYNNGIDNFIKKK